MKTKNLYLRSIVLFILIGIQSLQGQSFDKIIKNTAQDRGSSDYLAYSISISGNYAIIGAYQEDHDILGANYLSNAGSAYIFERNTNGNWIQKQKIVANDRASGDYFGYSVSISGNNIVVGAYNNDKDSAGLNTVSNAGSAYIFEKDGLGNWIFKQKINASDRASSDAFGYSVSTSINYIIVGAYLEDEDASGNNYLSKAGSAYIFEKNTSGYWIQKQKIIANDRTTSDNYGYSVSITAGYAIVGAQYEDQDILGLNTLNAAGSAYIYERNSSGNWIQKQKIVASDRDVYDLFGVAVSISGDYAIIGAYQEDHDTLGANSLSNAGSAYIFERDQQGAWNQKVKIVASDRGSNDFFGLSVNIAANKAIVGAPYASEGFGYSNSGSAYIFERNTFGNWDFIKKLLPNDKNPYDFFGISVGISGSYATAGAYQEDEDANGGSSLTDAGSFYIFEPLFYVTNTISISACNSYLSPNGNTYTSSGTYVDTLTTTGGMDSIITINLTISNSSQNTQDTTVCNSYTWPTNNQIYYTSGSYNDTLTSSTGCDSILTLNLTINTPAVINLSGNQATYCNYDSAYVLIASPSEGAFSGLGVSNGIINPSLANIGNSKIYYSYTSGDGCASSDSISISINPLPSVSISSVSPICQSTSTIQLSATPIGGTYSGSGVSGTIFNPATSGNNMIFYNYTDGNGCSAADSTIIIVNQNPTASAGVDQATFSGGSITLGGSATGTNGPYTYVWSPSSLVTNASLASTTTIGLSNTTIFTVSITDNTTSCSGTDNMQVSITGSALSLSASSDKSNICINENVVLTATAGGGSNNYTYSWTSIPSGTTSTLSTFSASPVITTKYYITLNDGANSITDSISIIVNLNPTVSINSLNSAYCSNDASLVLSATPSGGTFAGPGVSGNYFKPNNANIGNNQISYTYSDANGCSAADTIIVQINSLPTVNITSNLNSSYCSDASNISLSASPSGGTFSGTGVSGSIFNPANASMGNNMISYFYSDTNGCSAADSVIVQINNAPSVVITANLSAAYCVDAANVSLSATPSSGIFSGTGVSGNSFSPANASIGSNMITYSYSDGNGCSGTDTVSVQINALPAVNITSINSSYCADATNINLSASPSGGAFSGQGVVGNSFAFYQAGLGNKIILYSFTDANGCSNNDTLFTIINAVPSVNIISSLNASYCSDAATVNLGASPSGGSFSGNGISGSTFSPASSSPGNSLILYNYTDANGCSNSDSIFTIINALPSVSFGTLSDVCADVQQVSLTSVSPAGGSYSGTAVSSQGMFYPQIAGSGTFTITYSFTDTNGCSDTANSSIKVKSLPTSSFNVGSTACLNTNVNINFTGTASTAASYTWSFDNAAIASGSGVGPYAASWSSAGIKQLSLSVMDSGCTSALSNNYVNILSSFAMITAVGSTSVCHGDSVTIFANTSIGNTYQWYDTSGILLGDTLSYLSATQSNSYFCEVTPTNSCAAFSDTIAVTIKPQILANFTLAATACKGDMVAVSFNGTAPVGAIYNWSFDSGTIASGSAVGPYNIIWNIDSIQTVGLTITESACSSDLMEKNISIISTPAMITALGSLSFCDGDNVSLSANTGPYSYEWFKDGVSTSSTSSLFNANITGDYSVEVTDNNNGCSNFSDSVAVVVNTTNFNLAFTATQTNFNIPPFNTGFINQTTNMNDYYWMWSFGDGNSSTFVNPTHQYGYDGNYTVGVIAQNIASGCFDTLVKTNYITCNGGSANPCTLDPSFSNIGGNFVCAGDSVRLFANDHTIGITYQWLRDGILINGASDSIYYASNNGLYQLMLTDTSCSNFSQPFALTQYSSITPTILANGNIQPCSNDSMELYVSTSFNAYQWSNGANSSSIYIKNSGSFIVTVTDNNGCQSSSLPYVVNASLLQVPNICIVGIDTLTNHNRVVWERQNSAMIDSFKIYRESTVAGIYDLIGSQPFSTLSVFEDVNSNPAQMAYRYRITAIDTCGMETAPSPIHKTLHLTINAGLGDVWNLIWTNYEGFNFGSYRIYRGSDSTNLQLLTQIQSTLTSYTDLNPPAGNVYYQIEIIAPHQCFPDSVFSKANTNYNSARSNRANTSMAPNIGFKQSENNQLSMLLFPNPNKGNFTLEINSTSNKTQEYQLEVYSVMGKLIYQEKLSGNSNIKKQMHFETLSKGVYFIRLRSEDGVLTARFVVE